MVIHPAPKSRCVDETEEAWLERVFSKSTPKNAVYVDMDESKLPDRIFRDAWEIDKNKIVVNQDKKQAILDATINKVKIEDIDVDSATTIAALRIIIKDLITAIK
jgi:hypothetical protein